MMKRRAFFQTIATGTGLVALTPKWTTSAPSISSLARTFYVALHDGEPTASGWEHEVAGAGYSRVPCEFGLDGNKAFNLAPARFPEVAGPWGRITHWSIWDSPAGGNAVAWGTLAPYTTPMYPGDQVTVDKITLEIA
jgi:hypothetical protein